jgi:hypothetical protein
MPDCGLSLPCRSAVTSNSNALTITNSGNGSAIAAIATSERGVAVKATNTSNGLAIFGSTSEGEIGILGESIGGLIGVRGQCPRDNFGIGVEGASRVGVGVSGSCNPEGSTGVEGTSRDGSGVRGISTNGDGVFGKSDNNSGVEGIAKKQGAGVLGASVDGDGVFGISQFGTGVAGFGTRGLNQGVYGNSSTGGIGVFGESPEEGGTGIVGAGQFRAAFFDGDVHVKGSVIFGDGGPRIDHPLEPARRYLSHSFVGSPEMKNVYDGVVALDEHGECRVELPKWFEAVNCDFRYQLTSIGEPAPNLHVAREISNNQFNIAGGKSGMKISWQVTGIRKDSWAQAHPLIVEEEKPENERGYYLYPELYDQPPENSTFWKGNSELLRQLEKRRDVSAQRNRIAEQVRNLEEMRRRNEQLHLSEQLQALSRRLVGDEGTSGPG